MIISSMKTLTPIDDNMIDEDAEFADILSDEQRCPMATVASAGGGGGGFPLDR